MAKNTAISWCDHTFNPWIGCSKVSAGCANCYAEALMDKRWGRVRWGDGGIRHRTSESYWREPMAWDKEAAREGRRARVFCASLADVFEDRSELVWWREELFALIRRTPNLDWLLLTKRPENVLRMTPPDILERIWLGTSVEDQATAARRIPELLKCPARVRFLSCEPLLGPVDLGLWMTTHRCGDCEARGNETGDDKCPKCDSENYAPRTHFLWGEESWEESESRLESGRHCPIDWVIVGGESGEHARPMHPKWARALRDQCLAAGVPFFFKQWGEWAPIDSPVGIQVRDCALFDSAHGGFDIGSGDMASKEQHMHRVGKKASGCVLDGRTWEEFPVVEAPRG